MEVKELYDLVCEKAKTFGMVAKNSKDNTSTIENSNGNAIIRNSTISEKAVQDGKAYFGFIGPEEETSGQYFDFSFVIFPEQELGACVVALGVGSMGFKNDYQLALQPGLRRDFLKLRGDRTFFKTSFADVESPSSNLLKEVRHNFKALSKVIKDFRTVLPAAVIVDDVENKLEDIYQWLAMYAKMRGWATNNTQRGEIEKTLDTIPTPKLPDEREEIQQLLNTRKYVVLQGAPGTGKTWNALEIAKKYDKTYFEQFHAETTYSDFVYGLEPNCDAKAGESQFQPKRGVLYLAVKYALDNPTKKVLLIIDEINRANLSNVLGPVFFLFEYQANNRKVPLKLGDLDVDSLPDNLHVIATMNTADRSLAVVDFALRRRFAWYTLRPHIISVTNFDKETFNAFAEIFYKYATDEELNLQPGQSYFTDKTNMKDRMIYELMPLIKEYLAEGYLLNAKDEFCTLFLEETDKMMYE
jgi:MoxR-like ATPase